MQEMNLFNTKDKNSNQLDFTDWIQQGCASKSQLELFHGSTTIIDTPDFNFNNIDNDYGKGFYTTPYKNRAEEWSWLSYT